MAKQKVKDGYFDPNQDWTPFPAHEKEREKAGFIKDETTVKSKEVAKKDKESIEFMMLMPYINNDLLI